MRNRCCYATVVLALLGLAIPPAAGDVIVLADGSRLIGTVERMADGKIILATEYAGTLEIDASKVTSIETEQPVNVGMTTGDRLVGPIEWKEEIDRAVVETEMGGVPVTVEKIEAIWPEGGKSPEVLAMEEQIEQVRQEADARAGKWSATFEAGIIFQEGNTDRFIARGRAEVRHQATKHLFKIWLSGDYGETNDRRDTAEVKFGTYFEYLFTERFYAYLGSEIEYDEFENLDLRFTITGGPGYYWIKKPEHELKTRAGVGYQHETFRDGLTTDSALAEVGLNYRLDIAPWLRFTHDTTWYPTFESLRDYRLVSDTAFLIPLGDSDAWKLKLGALYEYKSLPRPGFDRLDQTYYANIVLDIK